MQTDTDSKTGLSTPTPTLKHTIGTQELAVPLHVFIEDDDTGKHVSCLELPMLYGFVELPLFKRTFF